MTNVIKPVIKILIEHGVSEEDINQKIADGFKYVEFVENKANPLKPHVYFMKELSSENLWGDELLVRLRLLGD